MKKLLFSLSFLCFMVMSVYAQTERVEVTVHIKKGKTETAMMEVNPDFPWRYQKAIEVFDPALKDEKRIKNKQKTKYKAKDIVAYEAQGNYYESKKVMIAGRGDAGSTLKALPNYALIERVVEGPITVYKAYGYPPTVASGVSFEDIYNDLRSYPEYFVMKESDGKVKSMHNMDIEKWIADAPMTSEKFANGDYGNFKRKEGKKLGNFIKGQLENENPTLIVDIIKDYNKEVSNM